MTAGIERDTLFKVVIPFIVFTLIWGSTWIVIRDQLGSVSPLWSVTYRFVIATIAMGLLAHFQGHSLKLTKGMFAVAAVMGVSQFCINFNAVYLAEQYVTSGLVATVFALLMVPNALLAWVWLGHKPTKRFLAASIVAILGIALLFAHEYRENPDVGWAALILGVGWTIVGLCAASVSNVYQARDAVKQYPLPALLAWAMLIGTVCDAVLALLLAGPPTFEARAGYWIGLVYLALFASVLCFTLYYPVVRRIGPGKAAYSSAMVPIVAMILSTIFEDFRWTPLSISGAVVAICGIVLALAVRRRPSLVASPEAS